MSSGQSDRSATSAAALAGILRTVPQAPGALEAVARLQQAGFVALWAGGCVRDALLGRTPRDFDIATNALPDQVMGLFPDAVAVGKSFGVVRVPALGCWFEVATFRADHDYRDGRRPERVTFTDAREDASRRDFTVNALFLDPVRDVVLDYVDGRSDLARRLIRCVGDPEARFREDHLRLLRAARFASTLGFALEARTREAVRAGAASIARISPERVRDELVRTLCEAGRPGDAVRLLDELGLLGVILPEVSAMKGVAQPPQFHPEGDVFEHTVLLLNGMEAPSPGLAMAALLHDVGKPATARHDGERWRFHEHAAVGAGLAEEILRRLRFSNDDIAVVTHAIRDHMRFQDVQNMRPATLRRLLGQPTFELELELHRLDCVASHGDLSHHEFLRARRESFVREPVLPPPWVTGADLMAMGLPGGPVIGEWKKRAYDAQLEGRFADRDALLAWVRVEMGTGGSQEPRASQSRVDPPARRVYNAHP